MAFTHRREYDPALILDTEVFIYQLDTGAAITETSIGNALKPGVRRVIVSAELTNEDVPERCFVNFRDGNDSTVRGRVSAAEGQQGFSEVGFSGYVATNRLPHDIAARPTYQLVAAPTANQVTLVVHCILCKIKDYPGAYTS